MTSIEERQTIFRMAQQGYTSREIAQALDWKISTVRKWRQRLQKGGPLLVRWAALAQEL